MRDTTVAGRYARALFIVTERRHETARALEDLTRLLEVLRPGTAVGGFLASPQVRLPEKRKALEHAFEGRVLRSAAVFVDLLLRKKRLPEFATIVSEFELLVEKTQGIARAQVVSAVPLRPAETRRLHGVLERFTHATVKLTAEVEPGLLGGALVRIGDRVIDRTVRTLLETISRQLEEVSV